MSFTALRFDVGALACGFDVAEVVEVVRVVAITPLPHAPTALSGIVNLRGLLLPVVDLRTALGQAPRPFDVETRIVVVRGPLGFIVDRVNDVEAHAEAAAHGVKVLRGRDGLVQLLDPRQLLTVELAAAIAAAGLGGAHAA